MRSPLYRTHDLSFRDLNIGVVRMPFRPPGNVPPADRLRAVLPVGTNRAPFLRVTSVTRIRQHDGYAGL